MREWLELAVTVPADAADAVSCRLIELGAPGVIEETVEEPPSRVRLRAHFAAARDGIAEELRPFLRSLEETFPGCAAAPSETVPVSEEDWAESWKQGFPPVELGRLRIRTPWTPAAGGSRLEIEILPAMAFGTGQHASTRGCLLALEEIAAGGPLPSPVLDVGTGSGILAIAAARLGAKRVVAVDDDPVAVEAARDGARRNAVGDVVEVRLGTAGEVEGRFGLVLANLHANLLRSLFPAFRKLAAPAARLVVAGLLEEDRAAVAAAAASAGWRETGARSIEGWTTLVFRPEDACPASC